MENPATWTLQHRGQLSFTQERCRDGQQSVRMTVPTLSDQPNKVHGRSFGEATLSRHFQNEDWTEFNRPSFWVYPTMKGFKNGSMLAKLIYDGSDQEKVSLWYRGQMSYFLLRPFFTANKDVLLAMEMGFIGYWGEMHSSTQGQIVPKTVGLSETGQRILRKALEVVPKDRFVGVRYPQVIFRDPKAYGSLGYTTPLDEHSAYSGSEQSRLAACYANFGARAHWRNRSASEHARRGINLASTGGELSVED